MKKILFLLSTIHLFSSCSSEEYTQTDNDANELKYAISINAKLPAFEVETTPLRTAVADGEPELYNMVVYKENGEVYTDWFYFVADGIFSNQNNKENIFIFDGTNASTTLYLPAGNYHLAFMIHRKDAKHPNTSLAPIDARDYNTDNFGTFYLEDPSYFPTYHNGGIYFNTVDLTVVASQNDQKANIELKPMWSYLDININDAKTFEAPEGTNALQFEINPNYFGFGVKSKLAVYKDEKPIIVSLDSIRTNATFHLRSTVSETATDNNRIQAKIHYLKIDTDTTILETRALGIPEATLENGYYYDINGSLGGKSSGQSMNIILGEFNKEDVVIEF